MTLYKIHIDNRNYGSYSLFNATTLEPITLEGFNPAEHKLFTNDVFTFNKGKADIIHSSTRHNENIPAVLILADNKTYGRENKLSEGKTYSLKSSKNPCGRLLYKCIPDDVRIPIFLVPYEIKQMGFSKVFNNLYVTIRYKQWDDKHPHANLSQTIGPVDVLDNFYEYQLYCKSLNASITKFNKDTNKAIQTKASEHDLFITGICKKFPQIEDRTSWKTFTIDPATSIDYDDGFSIKKLNDNQTLLSIYIANVTIWMDSLNLWSSFSQRISTIYLPDRKRPMLPTILSDCLCSLQQDKRRFTFVMDIVLDEYSHIVSINFTNALIKVFKNYAYEEYSLLTDYDYLNLLQTTKQMALKYRYINNVRDSHEVVCYLMILMNYHCAKDLYNQHNGIFRSTIIKKQISLPEYLPNDVNQFIKIWNSACAQYIDLSTIPFSELSEDSESKTTRHDILEMDAYVHITSPIRRLVDLLNMIQFQQNHTMIPISSDAIQFYYKWISELEYINTTMRAIRKVQNDCSLLDTCFNKPETLEKTYDGYCFDKLVRNDGLYQFIVFLPELRLASRITMRDNLENYEKRQYKLYLFNNEEKFKRKIRLQLV
jgi:exoribonuclease R